MKFVTITGSTYEILSRVRIEKNGVFMHHYALLGCIGHKYVDKHPKPHITKMEKLVTEPNEFKIGQHLILQKVNHLGEPQGQIHITAKIGKIKRGFFAKKKALDLSADKSK